MTRSELAALAECATPDQQREVLEAAARQLWNLDYCPQGTGPNVWGPRWNRFYRMLDYNAYVDAALMLLPEGWVYGVEHWPNPSDPHSRAWLKETSFNRIGRDTFWGHASDDRFVEKRASTPALALVAAIAHSMETENDRG